MLYGRLGKSSASSPDDTDPMCKTTGGSTKNLNPLEEELPVLQTCPNIHLCTW